MSNPKNIVGAVKNITKTDKHYAIEFLTGEEARLYILNNHVFRYYMSPTGEFLDYPEPINPEDEARIVTKDLGAYGFEAYKESSLKYITSHYIVQTKDIEIVFDKIRGTIKVYDIVRDKEIFSESNPLSYVDYKSTQTLHQRSDEYFFGGGMQNGRFSHKGKIIDIINSNNWNDGDVSSPCPFYWSSRGYGVLRNTWQPGIYDFGEASEQYISTVHKGNDFDAYYFINESPKDILNDYYELTGQPILLPEYAYYESHLNAFNRDYWVEVTSEICGAILYEDGKYYKSYKPDEIGDENGILESLNGDDNNYQFSARAMIDRYQRHDVPLGWFVPNDGYGSGYGQTDSLDGDIQNLKQFAVYSLKHGVQCALWTESNLAPADASNPKKGERDLAKEVDVAKVVALKCDVAWVGSGYSFGLAAVENATKIFTNNTKDGARPFIIMVDGWAGTQRYAGIWSGDQRGGEWEYIRFHIPTYIGASLSGMPVIGSDMDGIYTGGYKEINVRDYQWKAFTPLQLNMDGWGNIPKTPFSYDNEATYINRGYLKIKSMLMPYNYSIGHESIHGLPMIRAMFLEFPKETSAYTLDSQYQYMWGPNILVAPIYNDVKVDENSIRHGIYLPDPDQVWIDFITGQKYQGGKIYNNIVTPLWKIPIFIKDGSILPMTNPNNNPYEIKRDHRIFTIYPNATSSFLVYEDDGISSEYLEGYSATTKIHATAPVSNGYGDLVIKIYKTKGHYKNMIKNRQTLIQIMAIKTVEHIKTTINNKTVILKKVNNIDEFHEQVNCFYFDEKFFINPYLSKYNETMQKFLLIKLEILDVTINEIIINVKDFSNKDNIIGKLNIDNTLKIPSTIKESDSQIFSNVNLEWVEIEDADYYEIERDGTIFTNIRKNLFVFQDFSPNSDHEFRVRSVKGDKASVWSNKVNIKINDDPFRYIVMGVICNLNSDKNQTHANLNTSDVEDKYQNVIYDLGDIYVMDRIEYLPQNDNGDAFEVKYRCSVDNRIWSIFSESKKIIKDNTIKTILLNGTKFRFIEIVFSKTIIDLESETAMLFFKKPLK